MGTFRRRPQEVDAERITHFQVLHTADGQVKCYVGDWLVRDHAHGCVYTVPDNVFRAQFDPLTPQADAELREKMPR